MHPITIQRTLFQGDGERVVIASDAEARSFVGVSQLGGEAGAFVFVQIDRATLLDVERGSMDPRIAARDCCAGLIVTARPKAEYAA